MIIENKIKEAEFIRDLERGFVKKIRAVPSESDKKFMLFVTIEGQNNELQLMTQRNTPRTWTNIDRLLKHFEKHKKIIEINFTPQGD